MPATDTSLHTPTNAALMAGSCLLRDNGRFQDAYYLLRLMVERGPAPAATLTALIDNAHEAGMLEECMDFLTSLAARRPDDADLLNFAAGLAGASGRKRESRLFARQAAGLRPFFPSSAKNEDAKLRMLVLQCAATGEYRYSPHSKRFFMPGISDLYTLLDPAVISHRLLVDDLPSALAALDSLPTCDLIFNAISDPDYGESLDNAAAVCDKAEMPVFNDPRGVRMLSRNVLPDTLRLCDGVTAARSLFLPAGKTDADDVLAAVKDSGLAFPVIVRAPGFQGGKHMALLEKPGEPDSGLYRGNGLYAIEFMDVSFRDGRAPGIVLYPKYRAFFVNGQLFPMHLFIADQYEVHKKTSDPVLGRHPWLRERETDFLADPARHLPAGKWEALRGALASLGLDYVGVDFAVSSRPHDQGKLVLFECNPSMRNWLTLLPEGDPVQQKWRDVTLAAHAALCAKAGVAPWPFMLTRKGRR